MATIITEECINCGACEPECPNTAIYQAAVEYDLGGSSHAALSEEIFYIVPEKCSECVGFYDYEACAAVCPVDCCVTDPQRGESEAVLLAKAKQLNPDKTFADPPPSRFNPAAGGAPKGDAGSTGGEEAASLPPAAQPAPVSVGAGPVPAVARVERAVPRAHRQLAAGNPSADLPGELDEAFASILSQTTRPDHSLGSRLLGACVAFAMPLLGGLGDEAKRALELAVGNSRLFSAQLSSALNTLLNFIVYPIIAFAIGVASGLVPFTEGDRSWIVLGLLFATVETLWRYREGIFGSIPVSRIRYGAAVYGFPLGLVMAPLVKRFLRSRRNGWVPVEGFYVGEFEAKRERERRYGEVFSVTEFDGGYYIRFDLPRTIPPSAARDELGLGEEMPDYEVSVGLNGQSLTVSGSVVDPELRAVCGVSPAFPADFRTEIPLGCALSGFRHRYADKVLEIAVIKQSVR